ncbi:Transposase [Nodularia spumigena CCY9414]|nr:Transposase [Nodularia spumigena CCY9414]
MQDICQRIEKAYQLFLKHSKKGVRPPGFKKKKVQIIHPETSRL